METRASYILVGSFVLALFAGLFVFTVWVAKVQLEETRQPYRIYFTGSVTGLQQGSPVRYRGVPVGTVSDIRLDPDNVTRVRVTIQVQDGTPIMADSIASLEVQGITGGSYVQISGGTAGAERLKSADTDGLPVIPSRPSTLTAVVDAAPQLLNRSLELIDRLGGLLNGENQKAIGTVLANAATLTAQLNEVAAQAQQMMRTLEPVAPQIADTARSARETLATVNGTVKQAGADWKDLTQSLKQTSQQLNGLVTENREPLRDFTGTGLYEVTLLVTQLRDLSTQLSRVVTRLENDPSNFLFGGTRQGVEVRGK